MIHTIMNEEVKLDLFESLMSEFRCMGTIFKVSVSFKYPHDMNRHGFVFRVCDYCRVVRLFAVIRAYQFKCINAVDMRLKLH